MHQKTASLAYGRQHVSCLSSIDAFSFALRPQLLRRPSPVWLVHSGFGSWRPGHELADDRLHSETDAVRLFSFSVRRYLVGTSVLAVEQGHHSYSMVRRFLGIAFVAEVRP